MVYIVNVLGATMYSPCGQIAEEKKYTQHQSKHFKKRVRMQCAPKGRLKRSSALAIENVVGKLVGECPNVLGLH
eukprot:5900334-Pleurochrysis_carterae.AAC.1